jgi:FkbM family methyltransferase
MDFSLITKHITPKFVIDIGARLGDWAKEAKAEWPDAELYLIEGNIECVPALKESGFRFLQCVLSNQVLVMFYTLRDCPTATGCSYYRENTSFFEGDKAVATLTAPCRLDLLLPHWENAPEPILIKLDTQGSELDILRSGEQTLAKAQAVIMEVAHTNYNDGAPQSAEVTSFMYDHGFYLAEKLGDIVHPITRKLIQEDVLYLRK